MIICLFHNFLLLPTNLITWQGHVYEYLFKTRYLKCLYTDAAPVKFLPLKLTF